MSDYIKRDDVIDLLEQVINAEEFFDTDNAKAQSDLALWFEERILGLPKADAVEIRHGHWINDISYAGWTCSECGDHEGNKTDKYCHNCGARMDGEEQEHV